MLNFVIGRACTGKSNYIVNKAASLSKDEEVIIIVPEQFSFETERAVLKTSEYNSDNIQVMSFTKLYLEVSKTVGLGRLPVMTDGERLLLTNIALKNVKEQLNVFKKYISYSDFCVKISDTIRDFKFADIKPDELESAALSIGGRCGAKLSDIALIMSAYNSLICEKFIDPSDYLTRLANILSEFSFFKNKTVFIDSFTGFTGQQLKIIEKILIQANSLTLSLCTDDIDNTELGIFYNVNKTAQTVKRLAGKNKILIGETIQLKEHFYSNSDLKNLENSFFEGKAHSTTETNENIKIISCDDPSQEVFVATGIIRALVEDSDYRYRDFIMVARKSAEYENYVDIFCKKNKIPCFFDREVNLNDTILYIYINSLLQIKTAFTTENILNYIKCCFNNYEENDIYELENYIYVWNIKGSDWSKEWVMNPSGFDDRQISDADKKTLHRINNLRQDIYTKLSNFCNSFEGSSEKRSRTVYDFLIKTSADKKLRELCDKFTNSGEKFKASTLRQSWDEIMKILDSVTRMYSDYITTEEYINAFKLLALAVKITNVPQLLDEVAFGGADRIRHSKPKIAIILGANQGVFPQGSVKNGLLSPTDKHKLDELGISLNDDDIKSSVEENYLVYSMLCCPTDKTFILYSDKNRNGNPLEPSAFVSSISNNIKGVNITRYRPLSESIFFPRTVDSSLYMMSEANDTDFETLKESLSCNLEAEDLVNSFDQKNYHDSFIVSKDNSYNLFSKNIHLSATKFDNFYSCRLMYFLKYGLRTGKIQAADLNVMQRGTITHYVLENLINELHKDFCNLTNRELSIKTDELINKYIDNIVGSEILMTPRFKFLLSRIAESVKEVVYHLAEEFRQSGFEPKYCELEISKTGDVPELHLPINNGEMVLTGKIDRMDLFNNAIRIVDYKTGSKSFELSDTLFGLNMQMLIYLYAVIKNGKDIIDNPRAAGILYMPAKSKFQNESMAMNGLILDDEAVIEAMEKDNEGRFIPKYKSGSSSYIDSEMFELIFKNIEKLIIEMGNSIRKGDFYPIPTDGVKSNACMYCDYATVCHKKDQKHRKIQKLSNNDIKERLKMGEVVE